MNFNELFNHPIINLDKQIRYSNLKCLIHENVAEHSELVANIAMIIAIELNKSFKDLNLDLKDIAYRGVIHDWGESVTCDVTTDVKYSNPELPKILEFVESSGLRKLNLDNKLIDEINNARSGSLEGELILLADRLQSLFKMTKEYMIQRTKYWKDSILYNSIPYVKSLCKYIKSELNSKYEYKNSILDEILIGIDNLTTILNEKIDFL